MIISAERETSKLHSTLNNTVTLLETESHKCATLERDTLSTFTRLTNLRETAESLAERTAQDLRVAQFELEHKTREVERLQRELDLEKHARDEAEREIGRVKDAAWQIRQERIVDVAREKGRREGFERGILKAQEENVLRMQLRAEAEATAVHANVQPAASENPVAGPGSGPRSGAGSGSGSGSRQQRGGPPGASTAARRAPRNEPSQVPTQTDPGPEEGEDGEERESPYRELNSLPIVTPPQGIHPIQGAQIVPMRTGYSPTRRPVRRAKRSDPERGPSPAPLVDRYAVSIPSQSVIEQHPGVGQPPEEQWVTGVEYSALHGPTPPNQLPLTIHPEHTSHDGHIGPSNTGPQGASPTSPAKQQKVKFRVRRPSLAKTKQTAASWYRSLSFRKKPKQKVLIDPEVEEDEEEGGDTSAPITPADEAGPSSSSGHGHATASSAYGHVNPNMSGIASSIRTQASGPPPIAVNVRPSSQRHSRAVSTGATSMASGIRSRDYAYPSPAPRSHMSRGPGHRPRAASVDSGSTHISTSQFDLLNVPGGASAVGGSGSTGGHGYPRGGQANNSMGSLNSLGTAGGGKPPSVSGKSARSQAGGIPKKLSVIRENPMSRETTPIRVGGGGSGGQEQPLVPPVRPFAVPMDADRRSMKSARSTRSGMVAVNPDPESPEWQPQNNHIANTRPGSTSAQSRLPQQAFPRHPPADSTLLRPDSGVGSISGPGGVGPGGYPVIMPLRTKKSGLSLASGASGSGEGAIDTPTPMPRGDKGKGKERVYQPGMGPSMMIGEAPSGTSGNDTSPGIGIAVQTPSDRGRRHHQQPQDDANFLSPRQSSSRSLPPSRHGGGTSVATSTTRVQDDTQAQPFPPRSVSPIPRSTPKIFMAQGLPNPSAESLLPFEKAKNPRVKVIKHVDSIAGGHAGSVAGSEGGRNGWPVNNDNYDNAGMTPGPALFQPLPSRAAANQRVGSGQEVYLQADRGLHRAGSNSSLRSQGSYGKFEPNEYIDIAFWGAPESGQVQVGSQDGMVGGEGGGLYRRPMSGQSVESRRISYADP